MKTLAAVILTLALCGCGGTGSGTPGPVQQPTPGVNIIGTWTGTLTDSFDNNAQTLTIVVNKEHAPASDQSKAAVEGSMTIGGFCDSNLLQTDVTGSLSPAGQQTGTLKLQNIASATPPPTIVLTGSLTGNNTVTGTFQAFNATCISGTAGKFSVTK